MSAADRHGSLWARLEAGLEHVLACQIETTARLLGAMGIPYPSHLGRMTLLTDQQGPHGYGVWMYGSENQTRSDFGRYLGVEIQAHHKLLACIIGRNPRYQSRLAPITHPAGMFRPQSGI
jgi:hypothetical protein